MILYIVSLLFFSKRIWIYLPPLPREGWPFHLDFLDKSTSRRARGEDEREEREGNEGYKQVYKNKNRMTEQTLDDSAVNFTHMLWSCSHWQRLLFFYWCPEDVTIRFKMSRRERWRRRRRRRVEGECWMVCFCCFDSNEVSNGELSAARRDQRPRDTVETQHIRTHIQTHSIYIQTRLLGDVWAITTHHQLLQLTHGRGSETFLPCVDQPVMWSLKH